MREENCMSTASNFRSFASTSKRKRKETKKKIECRRPEISGRSFQQVNLKCSGNSSLEFLSAILGALLEFICQTKMRAASRYISYIVISNYNFS